MYIAVKVTPGAKKEHIIVEDETMLSISVREPPVANAANKRVREVIALHYKVSLGDVRLVSGHRSRKKVFSVSINTPNNGQENDSAVS
ncbi:MAG: DUF167 domain-containing protein [Patescibacteria group bacterium UBA2163]